MHFPVRSTTSRAFRPAAPARFAPALLLLLNLLFFTPLVVSQTTWTGATGTNWGTPGNWSPAAVPTAADDVTIPNTANHPVIFGGTAALAKSVTVQSGAMLTVNASGSLTIQGGSSGGMLNQGTVTNNTGGQIAIGLSASPGQFGLVNEATFNNAGDLSIDRTSNFGLWNKPGSNLTNTGTITIGAAVGTGSAGFDNQATFQNNGGELNIDRYYNAGIHNHAGSSLTNSGKIAIGKTTSTFGPGIYNFGTIQNNMGAELSIDHATAGIDNRQHSSFVNAGKITIGAVGSLNGPGVYNASNFQNNGGEISIDRSISGITNYDSSTVNNTGKIIIGTKWKIQFNPGIYNQSFTSVNFPVFNNNIGGEISIDSTNNQAAVHHQTGIFTNSGKITIGITFSINGPGLYNQAVFNNNSVGEVYINGITSAGFSSALGNDRGTFTNAGKIVIGAAFNGSSTGLYNASNSVFTNNSSGEISIDRIGTQNGLYNSSTFTNSGKITIGSAVRGGSQGIFHDSGVFTNNFGAEISIDHISGTFNPNGIYINSTFNNSGKITIGSAFSAGHNGLYNTSTFINAASGEISIDHVRDTITPLNTHGLRNDNSFTNAGKITIGSTARSGQWGLWNNATFNNNTGGEISIEHSDTCGLRNGIISGANFTNAGKIKMGASGSVGNYGVFNASGSTFTNSTCFARVEILSNNVITNPGTFNNAGTVVENASGNSSITSNTGIVQNLNGGVFSVGSGNAPITTPGYFSPCNTAISGTILWDQDGVSGVKDASVNLTGDTLATALTPLSGEYAFTVASGSNFMITPAKNINKTNGLSAADATAIQKHVANIALLPAPYKRIAADINKSNSITVLDASLVTQALLGNPAALAQITSWRFVPGAYTFPNPDVPWGFPEKITLTGVSGIVTGQDFKGIKLGDVVSAWANPANFGAGDPLVLRVQDQLLQAGEETVAEFHADQLDDLNAFQFALQFDPQQLHLVAIEPAGSGLPLSIDNFGTYNVAAGEIRVVWTQASPLALGEATPVFRLRFQALQSGARLSEALRLNDAALPAHTYNSVYAESGVELRYSAATGTADNQDNREGLSLRNQPNPFTNMTTLRFVLPEAGAAELRVHDAAGRLLFSQKKYYAAGRQVETLHLEGVSGVLFAELATAQGSVVRKMLAVKQ